MDKIRRDIKERQSNFERNQDDFIKILEKDLKIIKDGQEPFTGLHDYQIEAVLKTAEYLRERNDIALIVAPTGSGKSGMVAMLPYVLGSRRVLVLTPSLNITKQLSIDFGATDDLRQSFYFKTKIYEDEEKLEKEFIENPFIVESTDHVQLMRRHYLVIVNAQKFGGNSGSSIISPNGEIVADSGDFKNFDTIIVDEAHHYPAKTWVAITSRFQNKKIIFLTATPYRKERPILENQEDKIVYEVKKEKIEGQTIRRSEFQSNPWNRTLFVPELNDNWTNRKNLNLSYNQLKQMAENVRDILNQHDQLVPEISHKAMVLVNRIDEAETACEWLNINAIIGATYCTSKPGGNLQDFNENNRNFRLLFVCGKLTEGYDNRNVSVCVILRKVQARVLFSQFVGRCLRISMRNDPVMAKVVSYPEFHQFVMWNQYNEIAEEDPMDEPDEII